MRLTSESIARASARRPWWVVGLWVVAIVVSLGLSAALLGGALTTDFDFTDQPESKVAQQLLRDRLLGDVTTTEIVVVKATDATVEDPVYRDYALSLQNQIKDLGGPVLSVGSYLTRTGPVSADHHTTLIPVTVEGENFSVMSGVSDEIFGLVDKNPPPQGFTVLVAGPGTLNNDFNNLAEEGLQRGESIGIAIALIILIVVLGSVVAAVVPLILAIAAIIVAFGITALVGQVLELSFFITNMITMIGLAVGIDYSLFVVSRYREERLRGRDKVDAIARAGGTASRAVFISGLIVVLALSAMLLVPATIFQSLGLGAMTVVVIAVTAALTLLPAVLSIMGDRIERLRVRKQNPDPDHAGGAWDRIGGAVMRRPWVSLVVAVGVLLFLGSFYFRMSTGFAGVTTLPEETRSKQAFDIIAQNFPAGLASPVEIVVDGSVTPDVTTAVSQLQAAIGEDPAFTTSTVTTNDAGDLTLVSATLANDFQAKVSSDAVVRLRNDVIPSIFDALPVHVYVGGQTAFNVDFIDDANQAEPIILLWVLGLSFLVLLLVFRSIVIPTTSIVMNLLSVGAAYGLIVLFFERGVGFDVFKDIGSMVGFSQVDTVEAWLPLMLFTVLFGLSMDYHIFLLSRIKEHHDHNEENEQAVRHGLRTTASIITGAALIMVAVFGGFATGKLVPFQQMGFGLAMAVLIDATIIRSILVPATMKLLGRWNWYLPSWLKWIPTLRLESELRPSSGQGPETGGAAS